jgi:hypothetical protein
MKMKRNKLDELNTIEEILQEANAYGIKGEVNTAAEEFLKKKKINRLKAYVLALNKWLA